MRALKIHSMKHHIAIFVLTMISSFIFAQCPEVYLDAYYSEVKDTTIVYSEQHDLEVDIYQPVGEVSAKRPLVILAHGGTFVFGFRYNPTMMYLGEQLAKRGYVVASISYRLMSPLDLLDYESSMDGVCKAIGDGRAAVRYFKKSIEEGNPYDIDPNQIYFGGNSAGAVLAMHVGLMQESDITDSLMLAKIAANGGFEGDGGNDGYSSEINGVISLAGALHDTQFITEDDLGFPIISCHTINDGTVPYNCGTTYELTTVPELCGAGAIQQRTDELGFTTHHQLDFEGTEHVPWEFFSESQDQMFDFVNSNLYDIVSCPTQEQTISLEEGWSLFSTHIKSSTPLFTTLFSDIESDVYLVKDYQGLAYLPSWGYNGIGDLIDGQGYLVKMNSANSLSLSGLRLHPHTPIDLKAGWNTIAYLLDEPFSAEQVFSIVANDNLLIIVKDELGNAYLPEWDYNGIGLMHPSKGYQLKVLENCSLTYE